MKDQRMDRAAREAAKIIVEVMPFLNERKISTKLYGFFMGEDLMKSSVYSDTFFYYTDDLKEILAEAFDTSIPEDEDAMVAASDIRWAFDHLGDAYRYRVLERYYYQVIHPADSTERNQLNRAIGKMCDILNGWNRRGGHEGPGSRKIWTNARAAAEFQKDYSGGDFSQDRHGWQL